MVKGVGINDVPGPTRVGSIKDPYYATWIYMLMRGYDPEYKQRFPTYEDCTVCDEWLLFNNFKAWMVQQDWEGKELDKDLLTPGNKVYEPSKCVFISGLVNKFILEGETRRGDCPIGVSFHKASGKYQARCSNLGKGSKYLGLYDCPNEAHLVYTAYKKKLAVELSKLETSPMIADAILRRYT